MQSISSDNCTCHFNIKILNLFDPELQLINTKSIIQNKLKDFLSELKKFKVETILVLEYKKRNISKVFVPLTMNKGFNSFFKLSLKMIFNNTKKY